jgi:RNA polymerase sigma factor (sigma-70 family)
MMENNYDGLIDRWKVDIAVKRARKMGFRDHDLDDALQEIVMALLGFTYDEARSNGATEATAVTAVIDNVLRTMRRKECRHQQRLERYAGERSIAETYSPQTALAVDLQDAMATLSPAQRGICEALREGKTVNEIASTIGKSWSAVRDQIFQIRRHLERLGFQGRMACGSQADDPIAA